MVRRAPARGATASTCARRTRCRTPSPDQWRTDTDACCRPARSSRCSGRSPARRRGSAGCAGPTRRAGPRRRSSTSTCCAGHQDQPDRHVDRRGRRALQGDGAAARAPAGRARLPVDRLLAVHPAGRRRARTPAPGRWAGSGKTECGLHVVDRRVPAMHDRRADVSVEDIKRASGYLRGDAARGAGRRHRRVRPRQPGRCSSSTASTSRTTATSAASGRRRSCPSTTRAWCGRRCPAASSRAEQWLALDRLADLADGTMRLTTRQGVQFHVVHKGELHELVARHQPRPADDARRVRRRRAQHDGLAVARRAPGGHRAARRRPRRPLPPADRRRTGSCGSTARRPSPPQPAPLPYRGPKGRKRSAEPIYGDVYLPRKFKIAVAWPGDNSVDVLANDVGIVPTLSDGTDRRRHRLQRLRRRRPGHEPRPRGRHLPAAGRSRSAGSPPDRVVDVVEAVVTTQRDSRQPRRPPPGPPQVPRRGAGHRVDPRRGRPPRRVRRSTPPVEHAAVDRPRSTTAPATASSACRCRRARSPTATASTCARRCASSSPTAR